MTGRQRRPVDVQLGAVDGTQGAVQTEPLLAVVIGLPRLQVRQHHRGERLVDLIEIEVLQTQPVAGQQPGHRVGRRHQQAVGAVDVIHRGGLGVDEVGQRSQPVLIGPVLAGQQCHRGAVGQRRRVTGRHRRVATLHPEHRPQGGQLLRGGIGPEVVVAVQPEEPGDQVVEEAPVVGGGHIAVAGRGQPVLVDALDAHRLCGDRRMIAHRQSGARLAVGRDLHPDRRRQCPGQLEPLDGRLRPAQGQ